MEEKNKALKYINYFFDYGPIIMTVTVAFAASIYGVKADLQTNELLQLMLLVLALLATSFLIDRFRIIRTIDKKIDKINKTESNATIFFKDNIPDLKERIKKAKSISISGITLVRTSTTFYSLFKNLLENKAQIKLQMVNPENEALAVIAQRFQKHQNPELLKRESYHALDNIRSLLTDNNNIVVKHTNIAPAYGIWLIDENTSNAEIWVEIYSFRDDPEPTFHLLPSRDGKWFEYYKKQFELMWASGEEWNPDNV